MILPRFLHLDEAPVLACSVPLLGLVVGFSRCYLGVHSPGDVIVAWLLARISYAAAQLLV